MAKAAPHLENLLSDWGDVRWNTTEFVKALGDKGLKKKLPRAGLNTFCKHFQEMIEAEEAYVKAIKLGTMNFDDMRGNDDYPGDESAEDLLARMKKVDAALRSAVRSAPEGASIEWPGLGPKTVGSLLVNLVSHEMFHVGQLIAFCYATGVALPESLASAWFLSPLKVDGKS